MSQLNLWDVDVRYYKKQKQSYEQRPETSKCSRLEMRRKLMQTSSNQRIMKAPEDSKNNVISLDQYFKGSNFQVMQIDEDPWSDPVSRP